MSIGLLRTSDDVGAPVLTCSSGSLVGLLKAVLVDGYGAYAGLGWTNPFINVGETVAVFQNNSSTGTGTFVRIDDNLADSRWANVKAYENMTTIDDGLLPVHNDAALQYAYKHYDSGTSLEIPWKIVGDDKGFWIATHYYLSSAVWSHAPRWSYCYFGDYIPKSIDNKWNFALYASQNVGFYDIVPSNMSAISTPPAVSASGQLRVMRDNSHESGSVLAGITSSCPLQTTYLGYAGNLNLLNDPIQYTASVYLHTSTGTIGRFPGFRDSCTKYGIDGTVVTEATAPTKAIKVVDYGDYKEIFVPIAAANVTRYTYVVLISGKGFRNGLM